jgi:hypothetical protein
MNHVDFFRVQQVACKESGLARRKVFFAFEMFTFAFCSRINIFAILLSSEEADVASFADNATFQGCQMVCFQTKNPNLGKFWSALEWKMLVYFMFIWNILRSFGHLVMLC